MLRKALGTTLETITTPIARFLHEHRVTPNILTFSGLFLNALAAISYACGYFVLGGVTILIAGLGDMLDGAVARVSNGTSLFGAFTDSVVDRYSDSLIFSGVLVYFARQSNVPAVILVLFTLCGSLLVSYIRARAELVITRCDIGIMERPERIIILALGSLSGHIMLALWILAVMTHITAGRRIYHTYYLSQQETKFKNEES